ncbi:MAG TPA: hypothetical protein VHZ78_06025 [Rhizomicrobium sp.]|jgi:hypothetical protein|nr:hypothetical protein [Rhizomicrobium sp.]
MRSRATVTISRLLLGIGLLAGLSGAAAPPPAKQNNADIFAGFVQDDGYKAYLLQAYNGTEPAPLKAKCPALKIIGLAPPEVIKPPSFVKTGDAFRIAGGAWVARGLLNRCGTEVIRRLVVEGVPQTGGLHAITLIPGQFPGNLPLEKTATHIVLPPSMAAARCADFKKLYVLDTRLTSPANPKGWTETWTMQACGRMVTADVTYVADRTGMKVTAKNVKLH